MFFATEALKKRRKKRCPLYIPLFFLCFCGNIAYYYLWQGEAIYCSIHSKSLPKKLSVATINKISMEREFYDDRRLLCRVIFPIT